MKGLSQSQLKKNAEKVCSGKFVRFDNEDFYKIENYDQMTDFFMTITSSSDVWNTLWSQGGISAGRIDCNHAIFPYYTADKIADAKTYTGSCTAILVEVISENNQKDIFIWQPFTNTSLENYDVERNLYKNTSGSKVYFEEINKDLGLCFKYGWTSSEKYGLVKHSIISKICNVEDDKQTDKQTGKQSANQATKIQILDGCQNILPACVDSDFQNKRSVLLDAYKKTDYDAASGLTLFTVSSVVTDKAEPSEGLYANTCWFSEKGKIFTDSNALNDFLLGKKISEVKNLKGKRASCMILKEFTLSFGDKKEWFQVFNAWLDSSRVLHLQKKLKEEKPALIKDLMDDIQKNVDNLEELVAQADGNQFTNEKNTCVHHKANVLFNIMRGGIFADNGKILVSDFIDFIGTRNNAYAYAVKSELEQYVKQNGEMITPKQLEEYIEKMGNNQIERLYLEYVPLIFSRRHGDPSRPWNFFSIKLKDEKGNRSYNYEGNWRDIFQNWEALCLSYPVYTKNIIAKFLNAMTIDGFNPYRISKDGIDWEIPDPTDPWSNIGYWNDHQVIYLQKLLEFQYKISPKVIHEYLSKKLFSTANIPYRLKNYEEILKNPRDTVLFDAELSKKLLELSENQGTDAKLVCSNFDATKVEQITMLTKLLQIILTKLANFVPGGGIWMNTQRPEWNDANNALAGYGLSIVTLNYLYRMIRFLQTLLQDSPIVLYLLPEETAEFFIQMCKLYKESVPEEMLDWENEESCIKRKSFVDCEELLFEKERKLLYQKGHSKKEIEISKIELISGLSVFEKQIEKTIAKNQRDDGLYHTYNTLIIHEDRMEIKGLTLMLEGQVAALSSGYLNCEQALKLCKRMKESPLYVADRNTYILYPNKELPDFWEKNNFDFEKIQDFEAAKKMIEAQDCRIFCQDEDGKCHFNSDFKNVEYLDASIEKIMAKNVDLLSLADKKRFEDLYESVFNHISFTGRSGTFYAYEGLGSVYWHMVAKYLVAVQEYVIKATDEVEKMNVKRVGEKGGKKRTIQQELIQKYYDVRGGIGFNKSPAEYGALPTDPYSHTPQGQGAKQPGMTGQVKEEIITRWGELGIQIENGEINFNPVFLSATEYDDSQSLTFTRFGKQITYSKSEKPFIEVFYSDDEKSVFEGNLLPAEISQLLFERDEKIKKISVGIVG